MILIISVVFFSFGQIINEGEEIYDVNASTEEWEGKYDYVSKLDGIITPLKNKFETLQDENKGWFAKLGAGITAIPYAIVLVPTMVFQGVSIGGEITTGFLLALAIPGYIIIAALVGLTIWAISELIKLYNKTDF